MPKRSFVACAFAGMSALTMAVAVMPAPALAQNEAGKTPNVADSYSAGVYLGRTFLDARQCTGSGDYHQGCLDGVEESQFDRQADQAMDSIPGEAKPAEAQPILSPPAGMLQDPFGKPADSGPPNN
jgi:hypothetical protein